MSTESVLASPRGAAIASRLKLIRLPLAGTTIADVWAGFFGAGLQAGGAAGLGRLLLVHGAALALYAAGMTLNDAFDAEVDRTKHPERPIPSGAVSRGAAFAQGGALLAAGLGLGAAAGPAHAAAAGALAAAILAYDGFLKRFALPGALAMGACRYLDVQLGAAFARGAAFGPAIALGAYVVLVTLVSTAEDRPGADRARRMRLTFRLLHGIFLVDALSLLVTGHPAPAAAAAALVASVPLLAALAKGAGRPLTGSSRRA